MCGTTAAVTAVVYTGRASFIVGGRYYCCGGSSIGAAPATQQRKQTPTESYFVNEERSTDLEIGGAGSQEDVQAPKLVSVQKERGRRGSAIG